MIDLRSLTNEELETSVVKAVSTEKEAITNTTRHFQEIYRRRSYLPAHGTMFDYLTKKHGYCNTSAQLRISTLNLIIQVPMAQTALEQGELSMTAAANIATFLNTEKRMERPYSKNAKIELIEACLNKSTREVQKEFVRRNPEIEKRDKVRHTSETRVRIDLSIDEKTLTKLNQLRDLLSHVNPAMSLGDLIERLAEEGLDEYCPKRKAARAKVRSEKKMLKKNVASFPAQETDSARVGEVERLKTHFNSVAQQAGRSRHIPADERHRVKNDGEGCTVIDAKTGHRCGSTKFLQLDHVRAFSEGGDNTAENLHWMCGAHNRFKWESSRVH